MMVLATRALELAPDLVQRIADRFPLVFVDEAQDTSACHLRLLEQLFVGGRVALQRIGDCNQAILGDAGSPWSPADNHIDLGESLRLGSAIAAFASKITCHRRQTITGKGSPHDWPPYVLLVNPGSEAAVSKRFAELVASKFIGSEILEAWAIGWIHKPSQSKSAVRLGTYFPAYSPPGHSTDGERGMLGVLHEALAGPAAAGDLDMAQVADVYSRQLRLVLSAHIAWKDLPSPRWIWRWLDEARPGSAREARAILLRIVTLRGRVTRAEWEELARGLRAALEPKLPGTLHSGAIDALLAHSGNEAPDAASTRGADANSEIHHVGGRSVRLRIGTIASVKGRTHNATLVVQTTKGSVKDMCSALALATGKLPSLEDKPDVLRAVMNVFVAATRPRHLLCLAVTKDKRATKLRAALEDHGMVIIEVP